MTWWRLARKINRAKGQGVLLVEGATSCPGGPFRPRIDPIRAYWVDLNATRKVSCKSARRLWASGKLRLPARGAAILTANPPPGMTPLGQGFELCPIWAWVQHRKLLGGWCV